MSVKLIDLRVADLKRGLEDTTGVKSVLQKRLCDALLASGNDPNSFLFETQASGSEILKKLAESSKLLEEKLEEKLANNSKTFGEQL